MVEGGKKILCVGLVCVDIINVCKTFPQEDSDQRCLEQRWQRGGNAANNCTVLAQLGISCEFMGTVARSHELSFILKDFEDYGINTDNCVIHDNCECPMSVVILSAATGSRTIIHSNKNLPEITLKEFEAVDLSQYCWIHFEGRNYDAVVSILQHIECWNLSQEEGKQVCVSIEVEKGRHGEEKLLSLADVLFVSKDFATYMGYSNMEETLEKLASLVKPSATIVCPWGEKGAAARAPDGSIYYSPASPPPEVIDTLGAGDTFNAVTIHALASGKNLQEAITLGCKLAGAKVGMKGFNGLKRIYSEICGS